MRSNRILFGYVARYFFGFLAAFLASILMAFVAEKSVENYLVERTETSAQEGLSRIGEATEKMDLISELMYKNSAVAFLGSHRTDGNASGSDVIHLRSANAAFSEVGLASDSIGYMFMLFRRNDFFVSSSQCSLSFADYYGKFLELSLNGRSFQDGASLKQYLFSQSGGQGRFLPVDFVRFYKDGSLHQMEHMLLYLSGGQQNGSGQSSYALCYLMDPDYIVSQILIPEVKSRGFLYVEGLTDGKELFSYGEMRETAASDRSCRTVTSLRPELDWRIVEGIPVSAITDQIRPVRHLLAGYLCAGIGIVVLLTLAYSLRRYSGLKRLLHLFPGELEEKEQHRYDDYRLLTAHVRQMRENEQHDQEQIQELSRQKKAALLEYLMVAGPESSDEIGKFQECFEHEPEFFCVALVRFRQEQPGWSEHIILSMLQFLEQKGITPLAQVHSGLADELFLIELKPEWESNVSGIRRIMEQMLAEMTRRYDVAFQAGISAIGTGLSNISKCYEQARQVVCALYAIQEENAVGAYDISVNALYENPVSLDFLNRFYHLLICGQTEEIRRSFERIEKSFCRMPYLYEAEKEQTFYAMRNVVYTACLHMNGEQPPSAMIPVYHKNMTSAQMLDAFQQSADWLGECIAGKRKSKNEALRERIITYLQTHYQDSALSAYTVSSEMGISEKYLSQFLKEQTGEVFSAILLRIRIEKARDYLMTTDYSNERIAELTGFSAVNTFYRNFQKLMGVTPKVYKENHKT